MPEQQSSPQELLPSSEIFSTCREMVALQIRMALGGEALNPERDLPEVKKVQYWIASIGGKDSGKKK